MNTFIVETFLSNVSKDDNLSNRSRFLGLLHLYEDGNFDTFALYREPEVNFMLFLLDNRDDRNNYSNIFGPKICQLFEWGTIKTKYEHT